MHSAAYDYVRQHATDRKVNVIDIGSLNINGTVRDLFPNAKSYIGVDIVAGSAVDVVADAATWTPKAKADIVVCCEMLEHCEAWRDVIHNMSTMLRRNGQIIVTAANPNRTPHSGIDGGQVRADEFYANIDPIELGQVLDAAGFVDIEIDSTFDDVRATAWKP